jgi:L-aspartate oxidase
MTVMERFDFLVLGSGIAGLSFALKAAAVGRVAIVTKKQSAESNTNYAQGGIAAVLSAEDTFASHVLDTLQAGAGLCREAVVRTIVQEGPARIAELMELGMQFSRREVPGSAGAAGPVAVARGSERAARRTPQAAGTRTAGGGPGDRRFKSGRSD